MLHPGRVEQNLVFPYLAAYHGHLSHAASRKQSRPDGPIRQRSQILHRRLPVLRSQSHEHQFAQDGGLRAKRRVTHTFRKFILYGGYLLGDYLSREVNVRTPIKLHPHYRKAGSRRGAHTPYVRSAVHGSLHRESHQPLHFFGSHTSGFRHNHHSRRIEVREHIHVHIGSGIHPGYHKEHRKDQDQRPVIQREFDNLIQHGS